MNKVDFFETKGIYLILDKRFVKTEYYPQIIEKTAKKGVKIVQLREKDISTREYLALATKLKKLCEENNVFFIVNDRVDIAFASNADGVHLGQDDLPVKYARKILGKNKIIGISAGNEKELKYALSEDVDYISPGPVFGTFTKKDAGNAVGIEFVKKVKESTDKPVIPIGGINKDNIQKLSVCGIKTVALISAILKSDNPENEAEILYRKLLNI